MKIKAGIIGSGNIGTDLLMKIIKSNSIEPVIFVGRRPESDGIKKALDNAIDISICGIDFFVDNPKYCNVVFDCTNAFDAIENNKVFQSQGIKVIDLTPAKLGPMCIPILNGDCILNNGNVNMITCGGQTSIPILNFISKHCNKIDYIEIVSQIASKSAGIATRLNIDQYIHTTEEAIKLFTGCSECKVILNINPAEPCVDMQTTLFVKSNSIHLANIKKYVNETIDKVKKYSPFYEMIMTPIVNENNVLILSLRVKGAGDYLPSYAGNLDIINGAAINVAERLI